jgi:hypothetical protein
LLISTIAIGGGVGLAAFFKKTEVSSKDQSGLENKPVVGKKEVVVQEVPIVALERPKPPAPKVVSLPTQSSLEDLPEGDLMSRLFATNASRLPIVETIAYTSRVPWQKDRPAWVADYSKHYATSRHFIARSLNRKLDYFTQKVGPGDRFNVFKKDVPLQFYLVIDQSRCKMWFYYLDLETNERVLLKTYPVGLGRVDAKSPSGTLTPIGKYRLGENVVIYKPGTMGFFQDHKIEMVRVFGTRWIPFESELEGCTQGAKGFGIHGAPFAAASTGDGVVEDREKIGKYDSDGCIRLLSEDMEELFSVIITKPTIVELVKDFHDAKLPGVEKKL